MKNEQFTFEKLIVRASTRIACGESFDDILNQDKINEAIDKLAYVYIALGVVRTHEVRDNEKR